jgi:hypothetical protein
MMDDGSVLELYKRFRAKDMALNVQLVRQIRSGVLKKSGKTQAVPATKVALAQTAGLLIAKQPTLRFLAASNPG